MTEQRPGIEANSDRLSFLWLILATILGFVSSGKWTIPLAVWLGIVFSIRFIRTQPPARGLLIYAFASMFPLYFAFQGIIPVTGTGYIIFVLIAGLFGILPFLADRFIAPKLDGFVSTLVLPLTWTSLEYISFVMSPSGSLGSLAYTQYGNLPLLQILSVTGMWGITFLIVWFGSVVNWAWERQFEWKKVQRGIGAYAGILVFVMLSGSINLLFSSPAPSTVRVASIATHEILLTDPDIQVSVQRLSSGEITEAEIESLRAAFRANNDNLFEQTEREARAGAKIIYWAEINSLVLKEDEAALIERGRRLANQEGIYLGMALDTLNRAQKLGENKIILIKPSGEVAWEYFKARPVPGEGSVQGDGRILTLDTQYGKIASVICSDMDFPRLVRQAGEAGVDVMFNPANDWKEIAPLHMQIATFRAIENGFSLVRPTSNGFSVATDYRGRVLAGTNYFISQDKTMISYIPTKGVTTIYSRVGDAFAWLCIASLIALFVWVRRKRIIAITGVVE